METIKDKIERLEVGWENNPDGEGSYQIASGAQGKEKGRDSKEEIKEAEEGNLEVYKEGPATKTWKSGKGKAIKSFFDNTTLDFLYNIKIIFKLLFFFHFF